LTEHGLHAARGRLTFGLFAKTAHGHHRHHRKHFLENICADARLLCGAACNGAADIFGAKKVAQYSIAFIDGRWRAELCGIV